MQFQIEDSYETECRVIAGEIIELMHRKPEANLCLAAGHSSLGVFRELIQAYQQSRVDFSHGYFTAMDEWLGMNESDEGSCGYFLQHHFLSKVNYPKDHISLVDGRADPIEDELKRIQQFIREHDGIDYIVLGLGMNGHLALNEPGSSFASIVHVTALDPVTKKVGVKYFENSSPVLTGGVTIGLKDICEAHQITLVINGENKAAITKRFYESPPSEQLPATVLKTLDNRCMVFADQAAASLIQTK